MSRLPPALARRVDRLARRAHAFHRWAHHPLCSWYAPEVLRLGRKTRICLGCTLTAAGALAGLAAGLLSHAVPGVAPLSASALLVALVPLVVRGARRPSTPGSARRTRKLLTRFMPAATACFVVAQALVAPSAVRLAAAALAAAAVAWATVRYRRRGPDRSLCTACPVGPPGARCPGLAPIARRERALSRLAGRWIAATMPPTAAARPPDAPAGGAAA